MLAVRMPSHFGDCVMALPALEAVARLGPTIAVGPRFLPALVGHLGVPCAEEMPRGVETAVLLKPSFRAAWEARGARRRVGVAGDGRGLLLTTRVERPPGHRQDEYAAVARAVGAEVVGPPSLPVDAAALPPGVPRDAVVLLPGTASPETVRWPGFRALALALGAGAVVAGGPGDEEIARAVGGPSASAPLDVRALAALCAHGGAVVCNDSGLGHLAVAARRGVGRDPRDVHVVFGSTDPARTGPWGATAHAGTRPACWPCYGKRCDIGTPCLDTKVEVVLRAVQGA